MRFFLKRVLVDILTCTVVPQAMGFVWRGWDGWWDRMGWVVYAGVLGMWWVWV